MPLTLTDQDLAELQQLMDDMLMRPKDGVRLTMFFQGKVRQREMEAESHKVRASQNGHAGASEERSVTGLP